jgi:S1-C subfamily serine protease
MSSDDYTWRPARPSPPPIPPAAPRRRASPWPAVLLLALVFAACGGLIYLGWHWFGPPAGPTPADAQPRTVAPHGDLMELEKTTISIYKNAKPSVVHITAVSGGEQDNPLGAGGQEESADTGSGFIWTKDGYVVTNFHVVQNVVKGGGDVQVILADQTGSIAATVVGYYPDKDIAVLRITPPPGKELTPIPLGSSAHLQVGQSAFAIGNPFGLDLTLTTGVVSATGREIQSVTKRPIKDVIQTDAPINPGNSGGPLLDSSGRLIGMNTAIYSPSGTSSGIGFAIPVDEINRVAPEIIKRGGALLHPGLGAAYAPDQWMRSHNMPGVMIYRVAKGGPAAKAGLQPLRRNQLGDIITAVDGKPVQTVNDLDGALDEHNIGDTVTLSILRGGANGQKTDVKVTLQGEAAQQ